MINSQAIKNSQQALNDITIANLQIVLNTPQKTYLNQATKNKYLLKVSYLKKILKSKMSTPKNPSIIPVT